MVLILVALPLAFAHVVLSTQDNVRWQDSLGRICLLANLLVVALVVERVLRPRTGVLYRTLRPTQDGILTRLRWPLYVVGVGIHIGLATIAVAGFTYAADRLWQQVRATELLLFCLVVVGSLLTRWTRVNARRLATRRSREIRARETALAEQATELGIPQADTGDGWFVETEGSESKMRSLVTALLVLVGLIGLWYVWVDVIPALSVVNDISDDAATGDRSQLGELLMAAFVLLSTFVVARHIAGVFELPVLHRLPLDSALRNTTSTVAGYVLWIAPVIVAATSWASPGAKSSGWRRLCPWAWASVSKRSLPTSFPV